MQQPYQLAARKRPDDATLISVMGGAAPIVVGGREIAVIAGPCSVEGREMLFETAHAARAAGAVMLRGGAFKPRTSPYTFQGLGLDALEMLSEVRQATGMPIVTEVVDTRLVDLVARHA